MYLHISSADELEDSRTNNDEEEESNGPGTNVQLVLVSLVRGSGDVTTLVDVLIILLGL